MKFIASLVLSSALLLSGCGGSSTSSPAAPGYLNITGDWGLTAVSTVTANSSFPVGVYLTSTQGSVSGVAHLYSPCYAITTNVPVTGTIDTSGNISLVSPSVNGQVLTIAGTTNSGTALTTGSYAVAGGCAAGDRGTLSGGIVAAVSGTYSGPVKSTPSSLTINTVATVTQTSTPDANGFLHVSGTAVFTGSPCFSSTTIATPTTDSDVIGLYFAAKFTASPTVVSTAGTLSADGKTLILSYTVAGGLCNGDYGSGTLTKQ